MDKRDISVRNLIDKIKNNELILPEFQRRYVWTPKKVRNLFDSLYRGYPTGTILVWEQKQKKKQHPRGLDIDGTFSTPSAMSTNLMLLDGQQRLTSLTALMKDKSVKVKGKKEKFIEIMFNLEHPDEFSREEGSEDTDEDETVDEDKINFKKLTFVVYSKSLENKKEWVKVTDIFKKDPSQILRDIGFNSNDEKWDKYIDRIQKVKDIEKYQYVMNVLNEEYNYNEVTAIFCRINSSGINLGSADLALAQIASKWPGCSKIFEEFLDEKKKENFDLDMNPLIRSLVVYATDQCTFQRVGSLSSKDIKSAWEKTKHSLNYALNFLKNNTEVEGLGLLSPFIMVLVSYFASLKKEKLNTQEEKDLVRWIYLSHTFSNYSGSSETTLNHELKKLKEGCSIKYLINLIERNNGRVKIDSNDLKGKNRRSPFFSMTYMAAKKNGAKDWESGIVLSKGTKGIHGIQVHHIFPKKVLESESCSKTEINEIANLAFIGGRTNKKISAKKPEDYFKVIIGEQGKEVLENQFIPVEDEKLWKVENFRDFLQARREKIAEAVNKLIAA